MKNFKEIPAKDIHKWENIARLMRAQCIGQGESTEEVDSWIAELQCTAKS